MSVQHKIMFVCLGNICRSPMAEFVLRDQVHKLGLDDKFFITSSGTAGWHKGQNAHCGTLDICDRYNLDTHGFASSQLVAEDGDEFDYLIAMDDSNIKDIQNVISPDHRCQLIKLTDLIPDVGYDHVPDPWYTKNFDETYMLVNQGCQALLKKLGYSTRGLA